MISALEGRVPIPPVRYVKPEPVQDLDWFVAAAEWRLQDALNLLATFMAAQRSPSEEQAFSIDAAYSSCRKLLYAVASTAEAYTKSLFIHYCRRDLEGDDFFIDEKESVVYPDRFSKWASSISLVPEDFFDRVIRAHAARASYAGGEQAASEPLSGQERRELGRLRREKENFESAIRAAVKATRYWQREGRRVSRGELFDLLCVDDGISKEMFERLIPLLPPEFRLRAGEKAPKKNASESEL